MDCTSATVFSHATFDENGQVVCKNLLTELLVFHLPASLSCAVLCQYSLPSINSPASPRLRIDFVDPSGAVIQTSDETQARQAAGAYHGASIVQYPRITEFWKIPISTTGVHKFLVVIDDQIKFTVPLEVGLLDRNVTQGDIRAA